MSLSPRGFGLIDVIVGIALMLVLFLSLFGALRASLMLSALTKAKTAGVELANTQMEYLRGLSYDALGTVGGIPAGLVPQTSTSTIDGVPYTIRTFIEYKDDPVDEAGVSDANGITTDYKIGKVTLSYSLNGLAKSLELISSFTPPSIESSTGGGALSIHVVNAANEDVPDATVHIVNTETAPSVDFTTVTNTGGFSVIGGAATSSQYQVFITKDGYSSAQTYERTGQNINPTPGYFTVSKDQVTGATFYIDLLATLIVSSFSPATTLTFNDSFPDASNLASQTNTLVTGGSLTLVSEALSGSARATTLTPASLNGWGILSATLVTPPETTASIHIADSSGTLLPDAILPNNAGGFTSFPVSLTAVPAGTYPALILLANLASSATTTAPRVEEWSLSYTEAPTPFSNVTYTLTGAKTIGTDAGSAPIYKTIIDGTTGAGATKTETLEYDSYTFVIGNASVIESCMASPITVAPESENAAEVIVGALTTHTLPLIIETTASVPVSGAKIVLEKSDYAATVFTSSCGFAYFGGLSSDTYSATVSAQGHTTTTFSNLSVSGHTAPVTLVLP